VTPALPTWRELLTRPDLLLALGFGAGLSPMAPGTVGTLVAIPLYLLLAQLHFTTYLLIVAVGFITGCWISARAAARLGAHDHGAIVWDEIIGYLLTMSPLPWVTGKSGSIWAIALGFAVFRALDILKPWPISWVDRKIHGGIGVMGDDAVAGLMGAVVIAAALMSAAAGWLV